MNKLIAVLALVILPATSFAARPIVEPFEDSGTHFAPAGALCDFAYQEDVTMHGVQQIFFAGGVPVLVRVHIIDLTVVHYNLDTNYVFEETVHVNQTIDLEAGTMTITGLWWALPDTTHAGRFIETENGLLFATPNVGADFPGTICPALGGNPAP